MTCDHGGRKCPRIYQAQPKEQVTPVKIAGLVIFCLALWGAVLYGGLLIGEALR